MIVNVTEEFLALRFLQIPSHFAEEFDSDACTVAQIAFESH